MTRSKVWQAIAIALGLAFATTSMLQAAGGPPDGSGGGKGGGKPSVELSNNLSYPAVLVGATADVAAKFAVTQPQLGVTFSYGCDVPEPSSTGDALYPNTSCVSPDGRTFYTAAECAVLVPACNGPDVTINPIFWQKSTKNVWSADAVAMETGVSAALIDWGDNLESQTWTTNSVIRVETTPFALLASTLQGVQMWHVSGKGPDEQWGARADEGATYRPYVYNSAEPIIRSDAVRLNIAKLSAPGAATCPVSGVWQSPVGPDLAWSIDPTTGTGLWATTYLLRDVPYTPELNVGGKYVYGYNWMLRSDAVPPNVSKAGWWRLTFYADNISLVGAVLGTPEIPSAEPWDLTLANPASRLISTLAAEGVAYVPAIDEDKNLTFIDICIKEGKGGGSGRGG
jgi:hypothetical protein